MKNNQGQTAFTARRSRHLQRFAGIFLCGTVAFAGFGCGPSHPTAEVTNSKEMAQALSASITKGIPLAAAQAFMEKEGFECTPMTKAKWKGKGEFNYLLCKREDGSPPIKRLWEVAVMHEGGVVSGLDARTALMYP